MQSALPAQQRFNHTATAYPRHRKIRQRISFQDQTFIRIRKEQGIARQQRLTKLEIVLNSIESQDGERRAAFNCALDIKPAEPETVPALTTMHRRH
jgi:hypothetical protein